MNHFARILICLSAVVVLCQCSSTEKKTTSPAEQTLVQRAMAKPDDKKRSQFEKYIGGSGHGPQGSAGTYFQKQTHHSKNFSGGNSFAGQKQFKTGQSWFSKSKAPGMDQTYALGNKTPSGLNGQFKADQSRFGGMQSRDGGSAFKGADSFKTGSALTRSKSIGKPPNIIENYNDMGGKKSAYSEDEVRKLLNRN